jgi:hypothetical protein
MKITLKNTYLCVVKISERIRRFGGIYRAHARARNAMLIRKSAEIDKKRGFSYTSTETSGSLRTTRHDNPYDSSQSHELLKYNEDSFSISLFFNIIDWFVNPNLSKNSETLATA